MKIHKKWYTILAFMILLILIVPYWFTPDILILRWSPKTVNPLEVAKFPIYFALPLLGTLIVMGLLYLGKRDTLLIRKHDDINVYHTLAVLFALLVAVLQIFIIISSFQHRIPFNYILFIGFGFVIAFIGNYLPRLRPLRILNLSSKLLKKHPRLWFQRQRHLGYGLLIAGIFIMICPFFNEPYSSILALSSLFLSLLLPNLYTWYQLSHDGGH